jgi:hypothetical protein
MSILTADPETLLCFNGGLGFLRELVSKATGEESMDIELPNDPSHAWYALGDYLHNHRGIEQYGVFVDKPNSLLDRNNDSPTLAILRRARRYLKQDSR